MDAEVVMRSFESRQVLNRAPALALDVTLLIRWYGPPVGIARVEHELLDYALSNEPNVFPVYFDDRIGAFRHLSTKWLRWARHWNSVLDAGIEEKRCGIKRFLPSRLSLFHKLERARLSTTKSGVRRALGLMQRCLIGIRRSTLALYDAKGERINYVPLKLLLGERIDLRSSDVLLLMSSEWRYKNIDAILADKASARYAIVALVFDIIPLKSPHWFPAEIFKDFKRFNDCVFINASSVIVSSRVVGNDIEQYCEREGFRVPPLVVAPFGYRTSKRLPSFRLPSPLRSGRFALFVSTIEPRKNHRLLIEVWRELLDEGVPQRHAFDLVFVGRAGWMVDDLLRDIRQLAAPQNRLHYLIDTDDGELQHLYAAAAFVLYPSCDEGFGLPLIEAFAAGRAVISSDAGSLEEVARDLAVLIAPDDPAGWKAKIREWIKDPKERDAYEARIRSTFRHPSWQAASATIFELARSARDVDRQISNEA